MITRGGEFPPELPATAPNEEHEEPKPNLENPNLCRRIHPH